MTEMHVQDTGDWRDAVAEVWAAFRETDRRFRETDARLDKRFAETDARLDKRFAETDALLSQRFAETDRQIRKLSGELGMEWGRMVEALVEPAALRLFQDRGIEVRYVFRRAKAKIDGRVMELDLLLENGDTVVVVEVKSRLKRDDVDRFLERLAKFLEFFSRYRGYRVYGGVAGLDVSADVARYAYRQGLFVINAVGDGVAQILNDEGFSPKDFGSGEA